MIKRLMLFFVIVSAAASAQQTPNPQQTLNQFNQNFFIPNHGQWNAEVKYLARIGGMNAWITNSGVVYEYYRIKKNFDESQTLKMDPQKKRDYENKNTTVEGDVVRMQLVNAESNITGVGNNQKEGYYNYFIGNDKSKWASNVPLYDNVELKGVYKDINVKYYYDNGQMRYDYKAQPGADISQIKFKFDGQQGMSVNANGELVLKTSIGEVTNGKIYAYQMDGGSQKEVPCKFEQRQDGTIGLKANSYDKMRELIIDPLVYATMIGGSLGYECGNSIAIDASENAYITGVTNCPNYPTTSGAYQTAIGGVGYFDAFVTKLNSTGSALVYSTFIGGNDDDQGQAIAIDENGNAYITGWAMSTNYPTTSESYQTILSGRTNAFVTKLNTTGSALIYSSFIGGNGQDGGNSIAIDPDGNVYITGWTMSANYPATSGAYQTTLSGNFNAFVTKLNSTGAALVYSTFIGGYNDRGNSIAIDASGNAYITGYTLSTNYPTTIGAYQTTFGGALLDTFVTKLNSTGSALVYSTFIGGKYIDQGNSIAIDVSGNAYITGTTDSPNYPTTIGAYQTTFGGASLVTFVTKLNSTGSALVYSTFIGGCDGRSIAIDARGNAYITGDVSNDYPTTIGAYQTALEGLRNAFVTKLNSTGTALDYSTYIGGGSDIGKSIAIDASGNAYITGETQSSDYPTTSRAYQTSLGGFQNTFVTKLKIILTPNEVQQVSPFNNSLGNIQPVQLKWLISTGASSYRLQFSSDSTFATTLVDTAGLTDTTLTVSGLSNLTKYYWRVNAMNVGGTSHWSQVWNFKTLGNPTQAVLLYPGMNSTNIPVSVNFKWNRSQDQMQMAKMKVFPLLTQSKVKSGTSSDGIENITTVSQYWFELTSDTTSMSYVANDSTLSDTTKLVTGLANLTNYWWRVRAANETGFGDFTSWSKFTTIIDTPFAVQQVSPQNNSLGNIQPIQLKWLISTGASSYRLQFSSDSTFATTIVDTVGLTDTTLTVSGLSNLTKYYWRVNAVNAGGTSHWSQVWNFKTLGNPTQVVHIYPTAGSTNIPVSVNLIWKKSQDQLNKAKIALSPLKLQSITKTGSSGIKKEATVSKYWLELMIDTTSNNYVVNDNTLTDTTRLVSGLTHLTNYWWRVRAMNETGWQTSSDWINFVTIIDTPGVAILLSPNSSSNIFDSVSSILFTWQSAPLASKYELQIGLDQNFGTIVADTTGITDTSYTYQSTNLPKTFNWRIRGSNEAGTGSWSNSMAVSLITGINGIRGGIPVVYQLMQNYPNPFNPSSKIGYALPFSSNVKIRIFNLLGEMIKELVNEQKKAGYYEVNFNTIGLASGVYFYLIEARSIDGMNEFRDTKKMVLLK